MSDLGPDDLVFNTTNSSAGVSSRRRSRGRRLSWNRDLALGRGPRAGGGASSPTSRRSSTTTASSSPTSTACSAGPSKPCRSREGHGRNRRPTASSRSPRRSMRTRSTSPRASGAARSRSRRRGPREGRPPRGKDNVNFEFLPWCGVPDVTTCIDLLERTGCANTTIVRLVALVRRADLEALKRIPGRGSAARSGMMHRKCRPTN